MLEKRTQNISIPFFSVVIPIYNKGPHIQRSISSVLNQTFQNFELILVNDASTDNSLTEIQKFTDERIRLFQRTEPGPGGYAARNLGIEKAKGKWVAFLDADDEWYPNHLEKMHELTTNYPEIYLMGCGWQTKKEGIKKENSYYIKNKERGHRIINLESYLKATSRYDLPVCTSVACIKKSSPVINSLFPTDEKIHRGGDLYAWLKMLCFHKQMAWSNHVGAIYHLESVNMVTKNATATIELYSKEYFLELSKNLSNIERKLLLKYFNSRLLRSHIASRSVNIKPLSIKNDIFFDKIFLNGLKTYLVTLIPNFAFKWIRGFKRK